MEKLDYDLIVIGAGGAGLSGAIWAAEAGCSVIVLEAEDRIGGSTALSDGVFNAADSSLQRKLGLTDTRDGYFQEYMTLNAWRQPAALIRRFIDESTPTLEWLISLGVTFPERIAKKPPQCVFTCSVEGGGLYASGVEWPPRGHCPAEGGNVYIKVMDGRRSVLGVELVLNTRVQELIVEGGAVRGVVAMGEHVRSHAVLLATGGICNASPDMIRAWFPDAFDALPPGQLPKGPAAPGHRGDAVLMGRQAGAHIIGKNCGLAAPGVILPNSPGFHGFQPSSLIYVNGRGQRFAPETAPYAVMPGLIKNEDFNVWGVFDEQARLASDPTKGGLARGWDPRFVFECVERGDMIAGRSVEELAMRCGMRTGALRTTINQFNEDIGGGRDRWFLRDMAGITPIAKPPFYAFRYGASQFVVASVGPRIDSNGHVLDEDGQIIPGLFAAGEAGAGVLGERYVGGGNSVANAITMGRVAGMTIGHQVKKIYEDHG